MTDKNAKPVVKGPNTQFQAEKPESDKAFLERTNVKNILNGLMDSLYHHQPEDPIKFIYNYFENLCHQEDPLKVANDRLKVISHHSIVFDDCLLEIYKLFINSVTNPKKEEGGKKAPKITLAELFNKLIDSLTSELDCEIQIDLYAKIKRKEHDAFSFNYFKSSIKLIFLLRDYLTECTSIYKELESYSGENKVNKILCEVLIGHLKNSLKIVVEQKPNTQSVFQCLYDLSPSGLTILFNEKQSKISQTKESIELDEFLRYAAEVFIECINL